MSQLDASSMLGRREVVDFKKDVYSQALNELWEFIAR